jgi:hypothetical protein
LAGARVVLFSFGPTNIDDPESSSEAFPAHPQEAIWQNWSIPQKVNAFKTKIFIMPNDITNHAICFSNLSIPTRLRDRDVRVNLQQKYLLKRKT